MEHARGSLLGGVLGYFHLFCINPLLYFDGLVQDCSNSSVSAVELLQSCTKPSEYSDVFTKYSLKIPLHLAIGITVITLRQRENCHHFANYIFKCIFLIKNVWISHKISLKFVPKFRINSIPALVQIMTWCQPGAKPLSEPMMASLLTHIGVYLYIYRHICVGNLTIIGSDNGLSPDRRQAIIWTNAWILLIGPYGTNFSEILIKIHAFLFTKMHLKMSSGKWRPFCLGLNVLKMFT